MGFVDAVKTCLNKYVTIDGRAQRSEFWWFFLFQILATYIPMIVLGAIGLETLGIAVTMIVSLLLLAPAICVGVRRLHDRDMSGWWMLIMFVPLIGIIALIVIWILKGTAGDNRFGADPLA